MRPFSERQYFKAPSTPSRCSLSWNVGKKPSRFVRALTLSNHRHTTKAAATSERASIGRKKYHSSVMNLISAFIAVIQSVRQRGLTIDWQKKAAGSRSACRELQNG